MREIDLHDTSQVQLLADQLYKYAVQYCEAKERAAEAKHSIDIILASKMNELRGKKANLGYETAVILLLEIGGQTTEDLYKQYLTNKAKSEGLEKIIDALHTQISLYQTIAKILPK